MSSGACIHCDRGTPQKPSIAPSEIVSYCQKCKLPVCGACYFTKHPCSR